MMKSDDERVAIIACNSILDRAFGKPKEQKTEDSEALRPNLAMLTPADLASLRAIALKLAGGGEGETAAPPDVR